MSNLGGATAGAQAGRESLYASLPYNIMTQGGAMATTTKDLAELLDKYLGLQYLHEIEPTKFIGVEPRYPIAPNPELDEPEPNPELDFEERLRAKVLAKWGER